MLNVNNRVRFEELKSRKMKIDGIEVCKPIELLVDFLKNNNFIVVKAVVKDYHYHEVSMIMKGKYTEDLNNIHIDNIKRVNADLFICDCNWSTVKLEFE